MLLIGGVLLATHYRRLIFKAASGSSSISVVGNGSYQVGQEYDVTINLDTGDNNIVAVEVVMTYPTNLLQLESDQKGTDWTVYGDPGSTSGTIDRVLGSPTPVNGTSTLMTLKFKALAEGSGAFNFTKVDAASSSIQAIVVSLNNASFTVSNSTSSPGNINLNLSLQGRTDFTKSGVTLKVFAAGANKKTATPIYTTSSITTDATGASTLQITGVPDGTYDFQIKVPNYLSQSQNNVVFSSTNPPTLTFSNLKAGDLVDDNQINGGDFTYLKQHLTTNDPIADINQDGTVNMADFGVIYLNWGSTGN